MRTYISFLQKTPKEMSSAIAERVRKIRKRKKISQAELSRRSGVSFGSVKRFEQSGEISLASLIKIAIALDISNELEQLFDDVTPQSIEEILNEQA
ncbi:MAG: helix-turn-helix transcriptional regulator [Lachnospiraceae bacterium]|nr:helix-turn-helix transcriptional regulator [Lachnospiraceae bacterium]